MASATLSKDSSYQSALRVMLLVQMLADTSNEGYLMEAALEYLQSRRLGTSKRQLERDMQLVRRVFGAMSRTDEYGRKLWIIVHPCAWHRLLSPQRSGAGSDEVPELLAVHESSDPIVFEHDRADLSRRESILIRLMLIVEMLPDEDQEEGMTVSCIHRRLSEFGLHVCSRTIQRDLLFIREHFLILMDPQGPAGTGWSRLCGENWMSVFQPRIPELKLSSNDVVNSFLYGSPAQARQKSLRSVH